MVKIWEGFISKLALEDRHQYGSIKGSSTTNRLIELLDILYRGTDKCNTVGSLVVTDFSKAFDCVDYTLAMKSLYDLGVRAEIIPWIADFITSRRQRVQYQSAAEIIPWIADFLTSRRQRVQYQSATSAWETLTCDVPQGTKFGPITFIGMIDSAASDSKTHTFKNVDDLSLAEVRPANQPCQIEKDVQDLDDWADSHYLKLNPSKCKVMQVCFMRDPPNPPVLKIAGKELEVVTEAKLLGLTVQTNFELGHAG